MKQQTYSKNIILILAASFFYFASPMLVTPLITGFSGSIGASAGVMGVIGGLMNLCSLFCRPFCWKPGRQNQQIPIVIYWGRSYDRGMSRVYDSF